jgi:hypothetical protein
LLAKCGRQPRGFVGSTPSTADCATFRRPRRWS